MNKRKRGFEILKKYEREASLPVRSTALSAGYDFEAVEDVTIPPFKPGVVPTLVKTGVKSYFQEGETLLLFNRSSNPKKKGLQLANSVGVVDADYYNNPDNEGHVMFAFWNKKNEPIEIKKGDRIGQGMFVPFLLADEDTAQGKRSGGFGSTG